MAKDVDLTSKEWCDLIFEGRNKDFGAYSLRRGSTKRYNKSLIFVAILLIVIAGCVAGFNAYSTYLAKQREAKDLAEQAAQMALMKKQAPPPEEQREKVKPPEVKEIPPEVLKSVKVTQLLIAKDDQVKKDDEIKSQDELKNEKDAFANVTNKVGSEDRNITQTKKEDVVVEQKAPEPEKVFTAVEQMPQFPGGEGALMKYLSSHINYPTVAMENNVQGRVIVQFVVTKNGSIGEVKVARSVDRDLDREAVRVCKSLPNFIPGKMNGQAVNVWYTLPVSFKLQGAN